MRKWVLFVIIALFISVWAYAGTIQLPKTGQTTCYDSSGNVISCAGTGQDGDIQAGVAWPEPRFTNPDNSTPITGDVVVDQLTGLMWTRNANLPGYTTWQEALDYVAGMNSGTYQNFGYTDWRLPNIVERESLFNAARTKPDTWLISQGFTNVRSYQYWSSTTSASHTDGAWFVAMYNDVYYVNKSFRICVWPVRAGQCGSFDDSAICLPKTGQATSYYSGDDGDLQMGVSWPAPRFVDNADGTVVDKLTGLMWSKNTNLPNGYKTWQEALDYVAAMNSGSGTYGYTDWRLPNKKELRSLCDHSQYDPALPQGHPFTNVQLYNYWSSTTCALNTDYAEVVGMYNGNVYYDDKSNCNGYVWPVRAGQCGPLGDFDNDTVCNEVDNCPDNYNPRQQDCDGDRTGDVCDPDTIDPDGDGVDQACDICWAISNPTQLDTNGNCPAPPYTSDPKCGDACNVCMADIDNSGRVNTTDLGIMKTEFFRTNCATEPCRADINNDNRVNTSDLGIMKTEFFSTNCFQ